MISTPAQEWGSPGVYSNRQGEGISAGTVAKKRRAREQWRPQGGSGVASHVGLSRPRPWLAQENPWRNLAQVWSRKESLSEGKQCLYKQLSPPSSTLAAWSKGSVELDP